MSFVNEIDDVVYILTVLSFFIFIGCYYLFRTLSLSFYYTHYCKILLYYIIFYIVNTQFTLVAASFLQINYLSIYLSTCDIINFNGQGQLCNLPYIVQGKEIFQTIPQYYYQAGENNRQKTIQG